MTESNRLIIGIGNELRGDDAFGIHVVRDLQDKYPDLASYHIESDDPTRLINLWALKDVVIIDAIDTKRLTTGEVYILSSIDELLTEEETLFSSHGIGLKQTLELGKTLEKNPKSCFFIGVKGGNWELGDDMSESVQQAQFAVNEIILEHVKG